MLVFDYLAELTMSLLQRARSKNPQAGYAGDFIDAVSPHLAQIAQRKIKLLSNAGGMNPQACADALQKAAAAANVKLRIAVVLGDDLMAMKDELIAAATTEMSSGAPFPAKVASMNAYLGALPIVEALRMGADVVITGRCVDSAVTLAALIHHFNWPETDYDLLAAGSLVGHILECSTQATGGLHTDWWHVAQGWDNMGFPVAQCDADGSFVLCKPPGTGGWITPASVTEQMLYEVGDPGRYVLPDVVCDLTGVTMTQAGDNQVRIRGARGSAPTGTYKVSATAANGFRLSSTLTVVGDQAVQRADQMGKAIFSRTRKMIMAAGHGDYTDTLAEVLGSEGPSYGANARALASREVVLRIAAQHPVAAALDVLARELAPFGVSGPAGTTGFSGRPRPQPVFSLFSFLWPKQKVPVSIGLDGHTLSASIPVPTDTGAPAAQPDLYTHQALPDGDRITVPLSALAVARSGDKGDMANIAVIARHPKFLPAIAQDLSTQAVRDHFAHLVSGRVTRFDVPGVHAFNFLLEQALAGGGASSLRNDALGKSFAQILLSHPIRIPAAWRDDIEPGYLGSAS